MYLGSQKTNSLVTLVQMEEDYDIAAHYPDPQALFIANKVQVPALK